MNLAIIGLMLSTALEFVSLWQIEIATGWDTDMTGFQFPFFLGGTVNRWWARDVWYTVNILAWIIGMVSAWTLI